MVNTPPHYLKGGVECIDMIRAALTDVEFRGYCKGNNIKYTFREKDKGKDEDLKKARVYLNYLLDKNLLSHSVHTPLIEAVNQMHSSLKKQTSKQFQHTK